MTFSQLVTYFGNEAEAARALSVSRQSVNRWKETGIPDMRQFEAEHKTQGRLRANIPPLLIEIIKRRLLEERAARSRSGP